MINTNENKKQIRILFTGLTESINKTVGYDEKQEFFTERDVLELNQILDMDNDEEKFLFMDIWFENGKGIADAIKRYKVKKGLYVPKPLSKDILRLIEL